MRILHLNPFYFPYAGGIERRIREVGQRHAKRHEVHVLTSQLEATARGEDDPGIRVHRLPSKFYLGRFYNPPLVSTAGLIDAIRAIQPDVIDFHSRWSPSYANAFKTANAARVFTYHNTYGEGSGLLGAISRLNDRATRPFIARSDRIVAISRFLVNDLANHGFPRERISLVPNGIDRDAVRAVAGASARAGSNLVVGVGRVVKLKGFDLLVRALPELDPEIRVLVCGEGPERPNLRRLAKRLGVEDRVDLPGWVPEAEKLGILKECLAYAQPSRFEAFGLAALEALAMGAPAIVTRVGGLPEVVGPAGIIIDPEDPHALAEAINRTRADPGFRSQLTAHCTERTELYSWDRVASDLLDVYAEASESPKV